MSDVPVTGVTGPQSPVGGLGCPPAPFPTEPHILPDVPKPGQFLNLWLPKQELDRDKE